VLNRADTTEQSPPDPDPGAPSQLTTGWSAAIIVAVLMVAAFLLHDPPRMLTRTLWRDEAWVAVTLRAPAGDVFKFTSSTPVLFTAMVRGIPDSSPSQLRILPLLFTVACVIPAWLLGAEIDRRSRVTRIVFAAAVAFAPELLGRQDLKQYTAEAFDTLVILWLLARLETEWSRRRLVALGAVMALSTVLSNAVFFLEPAILLSLGALLILRRQRSRMWDFAWVSLAALTVSGAEFLAINRPGDTPSLRSYWQAFYIPTDHGVRAAAHFVKVRSLFELHSLGMGPALLVSVLLLVGLGQLARTGHAALSLAVPTMTIEQIALSGAHQYPLWDSRTSTWFTVVLMIVAVHGVIVLARYGLRIWSRTPLERNLVVRLMSGAAVLAVVAAVTIPFVRDAHNATRWPNPDENTKAQVDVILKMWRPGDVVVANADAGFGLGVYWPARPDLVTAQARLGTFRITYPPTDRVVVAATISTAAEIDAVRTAAAQAVVDHGRVWLMLSHWHPAEKETIVDTLLKYGTLSTPPSQRGDQLVQLLTIRQPTSPTT